MSDALRRTERVVLGAILTWMVVSALLVMRAYRRMEYALAAREAVAVAASMDSSWMPRRAATRPVVSAGRITPVVETMARLAGPEAYLLREAEAVVVLRSGMSRFVFVPVKDADDWDIVGGVVVQAAWWRGLLWPLVILLACGIPAVFLARRGLRRAMDDALVTPLIAMIDALAVMGLGMAAVAILARRTVSAAASIVAADPGLRFDPLALPMPGAQLLAAVLVGTLLAVSVVCVASAWTLSPRSAVSDRREGVAAWLFLGPSAVLVLVFTLVPLVFTGWLSLHQWDLLQPDHPFVGVANYRELATDPRFWGALRNTVVYSLYVPVSMALALGAALLLNQPLRGLQALRAMVFLPTVVSYVAIALVWQWMLHADFGLVNHALRSLGGAGVDWLGDPRTALLAVMVVSAWVQIGYQMVVYLAGLQTIPAPLYEAARLDGAGRWRRFRHITLPLLRPVTLYLFITGVIWSFQVFALVYVLTEGGPLHATDVLVHRIYQNAFEFRRMGYASAMSWVLFALLAAFTALQWRAINRRVIHAG